MNNGLKMEATKFNSSKHGSGDTEGELRHHGTFPPRDRYPWAKNSPLMEFLYVKCLVLSFDRGASRSRVREEVSRRW